jgi:hypothetical protein
MREKLVGKIMGKSKVVKEVYQGHMYSVESFQKRG